MIQKDFDDIRKEDIESLVKNGVQERRTLEYKEALPGNSDKDKSEFLEDVSSFANSSGGDLIYGVRDKRDPNGKTTGVPEAVIGLKGTNADQEIRRLDDLIRNCVKPRMPGVRIGSPIEGFQKVPVIIVRVPRSFNSPHMVTFKNLSRFYARNSAGKYRLDVSEIRAAFLASETLFEKIKQFRADRIAKIVANEEYPTLSSVAKVILHILPVSAFMPGSQIDLKSSVEKCKDLLIPISHSPEFRRFGRFRYNFDGFLVYQPYRNAGKCQSYLQLFRNGAIEAADASILNNSIIPDSLKSEVGSALGKYLSFCKSIGLEPAIFVALALSGVKGYRIPRVADTIAENAGLPLPSIDRDLLILPEALVEDLAEAPEKILRPAFDVLWQSAGHPGI